MKRLSILLCATAFSFAPAANFANAQGQPQAQLDHPKLDAKACADRDRLALADTHTPKLKETTGANPSDTLARTDGVICPPPDLDPDIRTPAPGAGRTPVIPPAAVAPGTQAK